MNKIISKIGAVVVTITVFLFAICLIADLPFGSYLVCMFLPLGYIMMALSTLFIGLSINPSSKADKWLKYLMILHGIFFIGCFIMPMTGVLAYKHFQKTQ